MRKGYLKIRDFCEVFDGPHATPTKTEEGPFYLSISSLENGTLDLLQSARLSEHDFLKWTKRVTPKKGDLLFSYETRLGQAALMPDEIKACLGRRMGILRPDPKKVLPEYLLYSYLAPEFQGVIASNTITGATVDRLSLTDFPTFEMRVLPMEQQRRVASVLSTLDAKIELNNRIKVELEGMAKLLYDYWFVQFEFPITSVQAAAMGKPLLEGKPYRASGGKMIYSEALGYNIPGNWSPGTAADIFSFNPSMTLKDGTMAGFFDMDAVPTRGFITKKVQRKPFSGGTKFTNGDVVVARITPCLENGKTALITQLEDGQVGFGSTEFIILRGKSRGLSAFAACMARSAHFRKFAILNMTGTSGRKRIEASVLKAFPLSIPSSELLASFEEICEPMFQKMNENEKQNHQLIELRDWLLPMLMNGQVTIG